MAMALTNRVLDQCVSVGQSTSNTLPVISGVPQGSILGPLFINDLSTSLNILLFVDDAKCLMPISSLLDNVHDVIFNPTWQLSLTGAPPGICHLMKTNALLYISELINQTHSFNIATLNGENISSKARSWLVNLSKILTGDSTINLSSLQNAWSTA